MISLPLSDLKWKRYILAFSLEFVKHFQLSFITYVSDNTATDILTVVSTDAAIQSQLGTYAEICYN
jgi:hypothetical protein